MRRIFALVHLAKLLVLRFQNLSRLSRELWLKGSADFDVSLELLGGKLWVEGLILIFMHGHDVLCNSEVIFIVLLINNDEEEVETRHNWRADINVVAQGPRAIISTSERISCGQDRGTSIERGVDASFCDRDGLLLHSFVDSNLIFDIHLVELIDTADSMIGKHQGTSLDTEFSCLRILAH